MNKVFAYIANAIKKVNFLYKEKYHHGYSGDFDIKQLIQFKELQDDHLLSMVEHIQTLELNNNEFPSFNMTKSNVEQYLIIDDLISRIKEIIYNNKEEFEDHAKENGYDFYFTLAHLSPFENSLLLLNTLEYPEHYETGKVVSRLCLIVRNEKGFGLWD